MVVVLSLSTHAVSIMMIHSNNMVHRHGDTHMWAVAAAVQMLQAPSPSMCIHH